MFGSFDENIKKIENKYKVLITSQGSFVRIKGEPENVANATNATNALLSMITKGEAITEQSIEYIFSLVRDGEETQIDNLVDSGCICVTAKGKPVKAKTLGQKKYLDAIAKNTITIGVGPAGTGKTYLAVAMAVKAFRAKQVSRIILTRPAVEAGENLGFLPGDLQSKVDPYLRPLYDALFDMLGAENFQRCQDLWISFRTMVQKSMVNIKVL